MVLAFLVQNSKYAFSQRDEEQKAKANSKAALLVSCISDTNTLTDWVYWLYISGVVGRSVGDNDDHDIPIWTNLVQLVSCICGTISWLTISSDGRLLDWLREVTWWILWTLCVLIPRAICWVLNKVLWFCFQIPRTIYFLSTKLMHWNGSSRHCDLSDICIFPFSTIDQMFDKVDEKLDTFFRDGFRVPCPYLLIIGILIDNMIQVIITFLIEQQTVDNDGFSSIACVNVTVAVFDAMFKMVEAWNQRNLYIQTGTGTRTLTGHKDVVTSLAIMSPDRIASASWDGTVKLWDLTGYNNISTVNFKDAEITIARVGENTTVITSSRPSGHMKIFDLDRLSISTEYNGIDDDVRYDYGAVRSTASSNDGSFFLTSRLKGKKYKFNQWGMKVGVSDDMEGIESELKNEVTKWNAATLEPEQRYRIRADFLVLLDNDRHFVSANNINGEEGQPTLWDVDSGELKQTFQIAKVQESRITSMCKCSDDDSLFLLASSYRGEDEDHETSCIDMFRLGNQSLPMKSMTIMKGGIGCLTSIGGDRFVYSNNHQAHLCDISSGSRLHTFMGHHTGINAIVYLPEKKVIATASWDRTIKVWPLPNHAGGHEENAGDV